MSITDIFGHVPQDISSVIFNYIVRSVNLDPNVKLPVRVYSTVPADGLAAWGVKPSIGTMVI